MDMINDAIKAAEDIENRFRDDLVKTFTGIPVRVDKKLEGYDYYISVSPKLKELLECERNNVGGTNHDHDYYHSDCTLCRWEKEDNEKKKGEGEEISAS